jgi:hypothetical protein
VGFGVRGETVSQIAVRVTIESQAGVEMLRKEGSSMIVLNRSPCFKFLAARVVGDRRLRLKVDAS